MADQNDKPNENASDTGAPKANPAAFDSAPAATANPATSAASGATQTLKEGAAKVAQTVGDRAKTYVEDGKSRANSALDELAQMINDAAATVDDKIGAQYGEYARTAADTVSGFSDSLKAKNVDDLIADATAFAKKSPAVAIGTAAALGFVLVRLVQSGLNADNDQA